MNVAAICRLEAISRVGMIHLSFYNLDNGFECLVRNIGICRIVMIFQSFFKVETTATVSNANCKGSKSSLKDIFIAPPSFLEVFSFRSTLIWSVAY